MILRLVNYALYTHAKLLRQCNGIDNVNIVNRCRRNWTVVKFFKQLHSIPQCQKPRIIIYQVSKTFNHNLILNDDN